MIQSFEEVDFRKDVIESPYIDDISITYCQNEDCTQNMEDVQSITISSRNNGIARFINIKTESWSIDDPNALKEIIEDFCKRASLTLKMNENKGI